MRVSIFDYAPSQQQHTTHSGFLLASQRWTQHVVRQVWPPAAALFPLICLLGPSPVPLSFLDLILLAHTHTEVLSFALLRLATTSCCWTWPRRNNPTLSLLMILGLPSRARNTLTHANQASFAPQQTVVVVLFLPCRRRPAGDGTTFQGTCPRMPVEVSRRWCLSLSSQPPENPKNAAGCAIEFCKRNPI